MKTNYKVEEYSNFLDKNKNKLILDILLYSLKRKYVNFNRIKFSANNRYPQEYIQGLINLGILIEYKPNIKDKKIELQRQGMNKYNLSKSKFYTVLDDIKELFSKSNKLYKKLKKICINRFVKRRLKKIERQERLKAEQLQIEQYKSYRKEVLNQYNISEIVKDPYIFIECFKKNINTVGDFLDHDILSIKKLLGIKQKDLNLIKIKLSKLLFNNYSFIDATDY